MFARLRELLLKGRRTFSTNAAHVQGIKKPKYLRAFALTTAVTCGSFYIADRLKMQRILLRSTPSYPGANREPETLLEIWNALPESKRTISMMIAANVAVFLLWRAAPVFAAKHFLHNPFSGKTYTMLTSVWSHEGMGHLMFNMWALWSFGSGLHQMLGREHFLAFYVSTGAVAGLTSHLFYATTRQYANSLGASGAIFGLVGLVYDKYPEAKLLLFFVIPTTAKQIIPALAAFDAVGLTNLWTKMFGWHLGHAAHLGGLVSGVALSQTILYPPVRTQILSTLREYELKAKQIYTSLRF